MSSTEPLPDGRLPAANSGDGHGEATRKGLRDVFTRMGFDDREIVALSGAHAVGRCNANASGGAPRCIRFFISCQPTVIKVFST